jgi:toxin-antitoxin system PIN domain toxin
VSYAIDVNILLYASDAGSPMHQRASAFLRECVGKREVFCVAWVTLMSYLRIATHPAIFGRPLAHEEAARNVEALLAVPHCRAIGEEEGFWDRYREVTRDVPTRGNLVPDAQLAALLSQHGVVTLYTHDRDFRKFDFLEVRDPFA